MNIEELVIDNELQMRTGMLTETIDQYTEILATATTWPFPPLEVAVVDGENIIVDGFHRCQAAINATWEHDIPCNVVKNCDMLTARDKARSANSTHGLTEDGCGQPEDRVVLP